MRKVAISSFLVVLSIALAGLVIPAKASTVTMPPDFIAFPRCAVAEVTQMCVESFEVDDDNDGEFQAIESGNDLSASAYLFDSASGTPSFALFILYQENQELVERLPLGSDISVVVNTRDWKPSSQGFSTSQITGFSQTEVDGEWITSMSMETLSMAFATNCYQEGCEDPQDRLDYSSKADFTLFHNSDQSAYSKLFDGMYISSNATSTIWPTYDSESMSWSVDTAGPPTTNGGDENIAYFNSFFPDSAIISAYGADPDSMVGVFKVTRKDGNQVVEQEVIITRVTQPAPGLLIEIPAYSFETNDVVASPLSMFGKRIAPLASGNFTSPVHKIKPKSKLIVAPTLKSVTKSGKKVTLSGSKIAAANSYQGVCIKGAKIIYGTAKNPKVTVKNLSTGKWNCRIRGVKKIGGTWSNAIKVKIS